MGATYGRHFVTTEWDQRLPLHLTSIGFSEHQGVISREGGFHSFHWLHTVEGCGEFTVNEQAVKLYPNQGILLKPHVPHSYHAETDRWSVWFMTFEGALANPITASLDLQHMRPLSWEASCPLADIHEHYSEQIRYSFDFTGVSGSQVVYDFLSQLKQFGESSGQQSLSKGHERLTPIYLLIEERFGDPDLGLARMADTLEVSPQYLNTLFRKSWGISPYQYLVQFRIQKSKELLLSERGRTVKGISAAVGFQDDSHFVHTFRRLAGMTPVQFRKQYGE
ncbi:AraC family transcriptional regulator [Paenibacillus mendelii]|uniref:Helix-turn-helix transcriptional regulator n=1 Tax=Paenibacillus mendelii TaxID=206163 RepID=A0ABV6JKQ9_9BACL|nr:AraC family transcriptional regulator [Paenibacillus mendelii]MCQ6560658.1 AraC family transcriptional regulator [Paenibacillus mendelii]